jgi:prolipoprotein diacylglyceryltransferase
MLELGIFAVPWALLIFLTALQLGTWVAHKLAARLGFVLQYPQAYGAAPFSVLDIRDGGWSAIAGFGTATLYALSLGLRAQYKKAQSLMLGSVEI